jgi:hypothetical protein
MEEESQTSPVQIWTDSTGYVDARRPPSEAATSRFCSSCRDTGTRSDALAEMFARRRVVDAPGPVRHFGP